MAKAPKADKEVFELPKPSIEELLNSAMELAPTQVIRTHIARALAELAFVK
jgi:hypothetical protein